jgi:hypothetical protein
MKPIRCRTLPTARIEPRTVRSMFRLFSRYYADVNFEEFRSDLQEKDECVLLSTEVCPNEHGSDEMESERIVGFTTLHRTRDHGPRGGTYLFTGDTVLDQCCWGRRILEKAFFWVMLKEKLRAPLRPLYWMLISKGYVTYLMMVRNFPSSYPRCDRSTPAPVQQRLDRYYGRRYPDRYSAQSGLVRSSSARGAVAGHLADPRGSMRRDPDVAYFLRHNPDYSDGDELACIAEVRVRDFARHFATAFRHRRNRRFRAREVNGPTSASGSPQAG